jgi:biotin operon repressor
MQNQTSKIKNILLYGVGKNKLKHSVELIQREFGISKQAVNKHLLNLEKDGYLIANGTTRNKTYKLGEIRSYSKFINIDKNTDEFDIYNNDFYWLVEHLNKNIEEIIEWGFTEILNNVKDHANAKHTIINLVIDKNIAYLAIFDNGVGIFNNIKKHKKIMSDKQILLELSKGKLTTDSENHTGLGIFWSAKAFDKFAIITNNKVYHLRTDLKRNIDNIINKSFDYKFEKGTGILMAIDLSSKTRLKSLFDNFAPQPDCNFNTTILNLSLISERQRLVSRSQAKQVVNRLEEFKFITFDFQDINSIGQGFADEIFRVFWNKYPELKLDWVNTNNDIEKMIKLAINYDR